MPSAAEAKGSSDYRSSGLPKTNMKHRALRFILGLAIIASTVLPLLAQEQSFEVATIKPSAPGDRGGRYLTMRGVHQFVGKNYSLKRFVAAAYNVPPRLVSGGPAWADSDLYDVLAATPGETRPSLDLQVSMLRALLADRFN